MFDEISQIGFVLGMSNLEVLLESPVVFGSPEPSVVFQTKAGLLLGGSLDLLRRNLPELTEVKNVSVPLRKTSLMSHPLLEAVESAPEEVHVNNIVVNHRDPKNDVKV